MGRRRCLILGASGLVGQRLQQRLVNHPNFEIIAVAGSPASAGKKLSDIEWRLDEIRPDLPDVKVLDSNQSDLMLICQEQGISVAFSGLPSDVASVVEPKLANAGIIVFSNASAYRRKPNIPMIIPEVNPHHIYSSNHYCATNCTLIPLVLPLFVISKLSRISSIKMRSEQALSGAGWELLSDFDALSGNLEPHIEHEAEKTTAELLHVLGEINEKEVMPARINTIIDCERVSRRDGHQVFVEVETEKNLELWQLIEKLSQLGIGHELPSKPKKAIHLVDTIDVEKHLWSDGESFDENPNVDENLKTGMAVVIGDLQIVERMISFSAYSHNTIRGAAGGVVYLAEFILGQ